MSGRVVVIGAGLAGLSAACYLAGSGHEVTVVEREPGPGGRAGRLVQEGFTFDTGPTVMTMPALLADAVGAAGSRLDELLPMTRLDPAYRACYADGSTILVRAGHEAMRAEIAATCGPRDAAAFDDFVVWLRELYDLEMPHFIDRNFDSPLDLLAAPSAAARLLRMGGFRKLGPVVAQRFSDERLRRLFSFQAMYAGLPPSRALAIYAVITYMDSVAGVYFPEGGMGAIPVAMARAAAAAGVEFRWGTTVDGIRRGPTGRVAAVDVGSGETVRADAVVCTLDLPVAYERLVPELKPPRSARGGRYSPSAVVWHVGVDGVPAPETEHHNIHFAHEWDAAFDALIGDLRLMPDPSRLVTVPSLTDPSLAAPGGSTLYVLEPVPHLGGDVDWVREREPMRERLMSFLGANGYPTEVVTEHLVTPLDWQAMGMAAGTPFALAHTFLQTGPFRPPNVERRLPGLFFAGSGTVPGVGVPMVLISGRLASDRVGAYLGEWMSDLAEEGYRQAARITRENGTTYYYGTVLLPPERRRHVYAVYALARLADDIVDGPGATEPDSVEQTARALEDFRRRAVAAIDGAPTDEPIMAAIGDSFRRCEIPYENVDRFFGAMTQDLTVAEYETWDDLVAYMEGSAAVIGEMMLPVLRPTSPAAFEPARALGFAFQLTNFLRDVGEDLDRGRVYVPQEDLRRFGADPWERRVTPQWRELMRFEIARNRRLYAEADRGIPLLPPASARCVATARELYARILEEIEASDFQVFTRRARVASWKKATTSARVFAVGPPRRKEFA